MYKDNIPTLEVYLLDFSKSITLQVMRAYAIPTFVENLPDFLTKDELHFHLKKFMVSTNDANLHQKYRTTKYQVGILSVLFIRITMS